MSSEHQVVRKLVAAITQKMPTATASLLCKPEESKDGTQGTPSGRAAIDARWGGAEVAMALHGVRGMSNNCAEVDALLCRVAELVSGVEWRT